MLEPPHMGLHHTQHSKIDSKVLMQELRQFLPMLTGASARECACVRAGCGFASVWAPQRGRSPCSPVRVWGLAGWGVGRGDSHLFGRLGGGAGAGAHR